MTIEVAAKKVDDAIKQGLEQLGASLDEVQVEILEAGGLFRKAKVRLTLEREEPQQPKKQAEQPKKDSAPKKEEKAERQEPQKEQKPSEKTPSEKPPKPEKKPAQPKQKQEQKPEQKPDKKAPEPERREDPPARNSEDVKKATARATEFIDELVKKMGFTEVTVEAGENGDVSITAPEGDDSLIIGRHGETLSAISFLAETLGRAEKQHVNIVADCNGYRERRKQSLTAMAQRRANECAAKHRKIKLEPMERVDRRTIHNALTGDDRVTTVSEGKEPYRYIVILPKKNNR
ncbi:MAG: KH domain-containing protein [Clostridiales bacterium]|nr:KH domain-containing protein [Clostridiales bacterium]